MITASATILANRTPSERRGDLMVVVANSADRLDVAISVTRG
jgi:hypothetical protein